MNFMHELCEHSPLMWILKMILSGYGHIDVYVHEKNQIIH